MSKWKETEDSLFRGDSVETPDPPTPEADPSLVRHILQVDGPGQSSPYLSTSESEETATHFALPGGFVLSTTVPLLRTFDVGYIGRLELLQLLVGKGKGGAKWHSAAEVKRAALLVEQHEEHLADFRKHRETDQQSLRQTLSNCFRLRRSL